MLGIKLGHIVVFHLLGNMYVHHLITGEITRHVHPAYLICAYKDVRDGGIEVQEEIDSCTVQDNDVWEPYATCNVNGCEFQ